MASAGSKEVGNVDFVIRGCSYTDDSQDCGIFPNVSDGLPAIVQLLVNSIESSSVYEATAINGRQCLCAADNCNASERLTNGYYVISSMMLFTLLGIHLIHRFHCESL